VRFETDPWGERCGEEDVRNDPKKKENKIGKKPETNHLRGSASKNKTMVATLGEGEKRRRQYTTPARKRSAEPMPVREATISNFRGRRGQVSSPRSEREQKARACQEMLKSPRERKQHGRKGEKGCRQKSKAAGTDRGRYKRGRRRVRLARKKGRQAVQQDVDGERGVLGKETGRGCRFISKNKQKRQKGTGARKEVTED